MQEKWLIMLCGHQYTGKSRLAKILKRSNNDIIISTDNLLLAIAAFNKISYSEAFDKYYTEVKNKVIEEFEFSQKIGYNIIIDRTNCDFDSRAPWLANTLPHYKKIAVVCTCSEAELLERVGKRESHNVSLEEVRKKQASFVMPTLEEGFDEILFSEDILAVA